MTSTSFGNYLRVAMEQKRISARDLAQKIDVSEASVSRYLSGHQSPGVATFRAMADELGWDTNERDRVASLMAPR